MAGSQPELTPDLLLRAYMAGVFPMAEARNDDEIFWVDPRRRGILPLDAFHISRSLRRRILSGVFTVSFDTAFARVVSACAEREETWINPTIEDLYAQLHRLGHAHSVEVWEKGNLVGGVYGVSIGAAFFGESMFSRRTDASKVALAYLVDRLKVGGYRLFDTQFLTAHLASLGAVEISRKDYHALLDHALEGAAEFNAPEAAGSAPTPPRASAR